MTNTIRNKILNYKDIVSSIYAQDEISFTLNTDPCECEHFPFIDPDHKQSLSLSLSILIIITIIGDLRIVGNKGLNYRESRSTIFNKPFAEITTGLGNCIENLVRKTKYDVNNFYQWKKMILEKINLEIEKLKTKVKPSFTKTLLSDPNVLAYLETLHRKYVIIPRDKVLKFLCF